MVQDAQSWKPAQGVSSEDVRPVLIVHSLTGSGISNKLINRGDWKINQKP